MSDLRLLLTGRDITEEDTYEIVVGRPHDCDGDPVHCRMTVNAASAQRVQALLQKGVALTGVLVESLSGDREVPLAQHSELRVIEGIPDGAFLDVTMVGGGVIVAGKALYLPTDAAVGGSDTDRLPGHGGGSLGRSPKK